MNYTTTKAQRFLTALAAALIVGFAGVSCSDAETDIQKVIPELLANMVPIPGKDFKMGKYEVTQLQWWRVMCNAPSYFNDGANKPVESVPWDDCHEFLKKLNDMPEVKASGLVFRLPSEAEWEYACRAGATGEYCKLADGTEITNNTLGDVAWFGDNSGGEPHPVGQKKPNAFGLYDMHGNVWEWCEDLYQAGDSSRVYRGGSWSSSASRCAAGSRGSSGPDDRNCYLGFRLAASQHCDFIAGSQSPAHSCSAMPTKDNCAIPASRCNSNAGMAGQRQGRLYVHPCVQHEGGWNAGLGWDGDFAGAVEVERPGRDAEEDGQGDAGGRRRMAAGDGREQGGDEVFKV